MEERRLYVGGLSEEVLEKDIKTKFSEFGSVKNVELRCKENYGNRRYFAYINLEADKNSIDNCIRTCNNADWKGGVLKVQPAKDSYLQTVQKDILEKRHSAPEAKITEKRTKKIQPIKKEESSDDSDDEPKSYLGVPAWTGFKSKAASSQQAPSTSKQTVQVDETPPREVKTKAATTKAAAASSGVLKRLYIGSLPESALETDIKKKFGEFGEVKSVEIKCKENYGNKRYFAYIDLHTDENRVTQCIRQCDNQSWQGAQLKVQLAKESFLQKAQNEILERKTYDADSSFREPSRREDDFRQPKRKVSGEEPMEFDDVGRSNFKQRGQQYDHPTERENNLNKRKTWNDSGEYQTDREAGFNRRDRSQATDYSDGRSWNQQNRYQREQFPRRSGEAHTGRTRDGESNAFESEKIGLFDEIDAADELGLEQEGFLSDGEDEKAKQIDATDDPISEQNLKELFDHTSGNQAFTLSSLFADQLKVEEVSFSDDDEERPSRKFRQEDERFEEEYWKRAAHVDQRSWQEMVHKGERRSYQSKTASTFFILPGDERLKEGGEVFRTDEDPAQFVECWAEQAEQLTQRLLQRKRNTRVQYQMAQRATGKSSQTVGKKKAFRKSRTMTS